jgi:hypothetical protein
MKCEACGAKLRTIKRASRWHTVTRECPNGCWGCGGCGETHRKGEKCPYPHCENCGRGLDEGEVCACLTAPPLRPYVPPDDEIPF